MANLSDYTDYLTRTITSLREHANDTGHCQEFRDQCTKDLPQLERELTQELERSA